MRIPATAALLALLALAPAVEAGEWTFWRGPHQNGVSSDKDLVSSWSLGGENLVWRRDFTGRSTPVVFDGRVCANGRAGEGIMRQEVVACWDAETGEPRWERRFNVYNTAVPWNRVGWASVTADAETGYLYAQNVDGHLLCLDRDGKTVWEWRLGEDLGRKSGYGGRTNTPIVDEDRLIVHVISSGWGPNRGPVFDRFFAFDKRTGELVWVSPPGEAPQDLNTQSAPVVAVIGGERLVIGGFSDGWVHAYRSRTGEEVWKFRLSQRGLNSAPVVAGDTVFVSHSEENLDEGTMGRLVAFDASGKGDITSAEKWRINELTAGFPSPLYHEGRLYVLDNSANLYAIDAESGALLWEHNVGTVGKSSPVWADGKIFVTEVNGNVHVLKPGAEGATELDHEHLEMPDGRYAEIYASPAIAYGRIYFTTEEGIYCVGDKEAPFAAEAGEPVRLAEPPADPEARPAHLQVVPVAAVARAGEKVAFKARLFDAQGRFLREADATWSLAGLPGSVSAGGELALGTEIAGTQVGSVVAKVGDLEATAWVRAAGPLPWHEGFDELAVDKFPTTWIGIGKSGSVQELDGEKVLRMTDPQKGAPRVTSFLGIDSMSGYVVQADVMGTQKGRRRSDVGIVNSGYTLDLQGNHQRLEISSWTSELRMAKRVSFEWEMGTWYTMKLRVDHQDGKAIVRGKVWRRGESEPAEWSITAEDPLPIRHGSPGVYGFSPVDAYFDNVQVTVSE